MTARHLILALGPLSETVIPDVPGLARFEGPAFHSARWDHSFDLKGRRVAVVGTGASAIQVIPAIQRQVDRRYIIEAINAEDLRARLDDELRRCGISFTLADDFAFNLPLTRRAFNDYARAGRDPEFGRGEDAYDVLGYPRPDGDNDCPSRTMYPLGGDRLYACIYGLSTFSTQRGLVCDRSSRVLHADGSPWQNLYAVGTCAASVLNGHYPAHGMSIGTGLVFGYLAGLHATDGLGRLARQARL